MGLARAPLDHLLDDFRGLEQFVGRVALSISLVKELRPDDAALIDEEGSGRCKSLVPRETSVWASVDCSVCLGGVPPG
jgi:hypothetical protein